MVWGYGVMLGGGDDCGFGFMMCGFDCLGERRRMYGVRCVLDVGIRNGECLERFVCGGG